MPVPVNARDAYITGVGVLCPAGASTQGDILHAVDAIGRAGASFDDAHCPPFFIRQIPPIEKPVAKPGDLRQMGEMMLYAVEAARAAMQSAGVDGNPALMSSLNTLVSAGCGEGDPQLDQRLREDLFASDGSGRALNERLMSDARPSLFLGQLPNLVASNIAIVTGMKAPSRTFIGEELAGVQTLENAVRRIRAGQGDLFLVGGTKSAGCSRMLMRLASGGLLRTAPLPERVWDAAGMCVGSASAFLIVEAGEHARGRGARLLARVREVVTSFADRSNDDTFSDSLSGQWASLRSTIGGGPFALMCGASGAPQATRVERRVLEELDGAGAEFYLRTTARALGHSLEASFLVNVALGVMSLERRTLLAPLDPTDRLERAAPGALEQLVVSSIGSRQGEGFAVMEVGDA